MGKLFLMVSMVTEILFTVIFLVFHSSARPLLICVFLENAAGKALVWTGVGPQGGSGRVLGRLWGTAGPGQNHSARLLKPSPCYLSAPSRARPCRGGTILPALLHSFRAPLCAHHTCSPEPLAACSGQLGRSQHLYRRPVRGWWGRLPRARGPGPLRDCRWHGSCVPRGCQC